MEELALPLISLSWLDGMRDTFLLPHPLPLVAGVRIGPGIMRAGELALPPPHTYLLQHSREQTLQLTWAAQRNWAWIWELQVIQPPGLECKKSVSASWLLDSGAGVGETPFSPPSILIICGRLKSWPYPSLATTCRRAGPVPHLVIRVNLALIAGIASELA